MRYPSVKNPKQMEKQIKELEGKIAELESLHARIKVTHSEIVNAGIESGLKCQSLTEELRNARIEIDGHLKAREELRQLWEAAQKDLRDTNETIHYMKRQAETVSRLVECLKDID